MTPAGSFGMFVSTLICGWVKARQSAAADPADSGPAAGLHGRRSIQLLLRY
jgi:hypothetical protein